LAAVTPADLRAIVEALVARARSGDVAAAREVLDRLLGKSVAFVHAEASIDLDVLHAPVSELRRQLLNEPEYLEWCRARAVEADRTDWLR
jgi:ribosomal protein L17